MVRRPRNPSAALASLIVLGCGGSRTTGAPELRASAPLTIDGNAWTYRGATLHFMDRKERWEAALGPPTRVVEEAQGESLVWDEMGLTVSTLRTPDRRSYVQRVRLELGEVARASPVRLSDHAEPDGARCPAEGYRGAWVWNAAKLKGGRVPVATLLSAMSPDPAVNRGAARLETHAFDPDAFVVHAYAPIACDGPGPPPRCTEYVDTVEFEASLAPSE